MTLRKRALGLAFGTVWGLIVCAATILSKIQGFGDTLVGLRHYYPGFRVSYPGAVVGLLWGFASGFVVGILVAWLYEVFCGLLYKAETSTK
jgi:hypothetical protein